MGQEMKDTDFMPWLKKQIKPQKEKQLTPRQSAVALRSHLQMLVGAK